MAAPIVECKVLSDVHVDLDLHFTDKKRSDSNTCLSRFFFVLPQKLFCGSSNIANKSVKLSTARQISNISADNFEERSESSSNDEDLKYSQSFVISSTSCNSLSHSVRSTCATKRERETEASKLNLKSDAQYTKTTVQNINVSEVENASTSGNPTDTVQSITDHKEDITVCETTNSCTQASQFSASEPSFCKALKKDTEGDLVLVRSSSGRVCACCRKTQLTSHPPGLALEHILSKNFDSSSNNINNDNSFDSHIDGCHSSTSRDCNRRRSDTGCEKIVSSSEAYNEHCSCINGIITLEHKMETFLADVGFQVWSGALLLCDFIIHQAETLFPANGHVTVLDLGAGPGITSVVAAMFAQQVLCTDYRTDIVALAERNWLRNESLLPQVECQDMVFRVLDWTQEHLYNGDDDEDEYSIKKRDQEMFDNVTLILAAEVIYDDDLTDSFFKTIYNLLLSAPDKNVIVALERRVVFKTDNLEVCSPAYEHFHENLEDLVTVDEGPIRFTCEQLYTSFPQYVQYTRTNEMELWKLSSFLVDKNIQP